MTVKIPVGIKRLDPDAQLPRYAHPGDAGADLFALEDTIIPPGETRAVRTGLAMEIPEGWEIQIRPRSGWALKRQEYMLPNAPGTIDAGYRAEVGVLIRNVPGTGGPLIIQKGDRIAQAVLGRAYEAVWGEVEELSETERGLGGFGSTGTR